MFTSIGFFVLAYLLGVFPSGVLVAKFYKVDLQKTGSGNIGATNVARTLGPVPGVLTLLLDVLKGFLAISIQPEVNSIYLAGFLAVLGHCLSLPPFLKGGKGVATALGVCLAISWQLAVLEIFVFALSFYCSKIVSISSLAAALTLVVYSCWDFNNQKLYLVAIAALVIIRHQPNIKRLLCGEEKAFSVKKN